MKLADWLQLTLALAAASAAIMLWAHYRPGVRPEDDVRSFSGVAVAATEVVLKWVDDAF